jgi:hypothetical protein
MGADSENHRFRPARCIGDAVMRLIAAFAVVLVIAFACAGCGGLGSD